MNRDEVEETAALLLVLADTLDVNQALLARGVVLTLARKSYTDYDAVRRHMVAMDERQ